MCLSSISGCQDHVADICLYIPFCVIFVVLGIIQIISGIFYFITIPVIKLIINIGIGCWVILTGISGGMVACVCASSPKKHEFLLYCSISVLVVNTINLIFLEFGQIKDLFVDGDQINMGKEYEVLESVNGRLITTITAITSVLISFVESQISFCLLNRMQISHNKAKKLKRAKNRYIDTDQAADLEYVIPKKEEPNRKLSNDDTTVQVYTKSWVFEGTAEDDHDRLSLSMSSSSSSPSHSNAPLNHSAAGSSSHNPHHSSTSHQRRVSKISDANSERFVLQMSSFSRCATPSPVPRSGQTTPTISASAAASVLCHYNDYHDYSNSSGGAPKANRLTVDYVTSSGKIKTSTIPTTSALIGNGQCGPSSITSSQQDDSLPYASLLAELELSLIEKKMQANMSPDNTSLTTSTDKHCSSKSSSKDLEFSKELEAALQLIQELETPSDGPLEHAAHRAHILRSESEKTLSAALSLPSPEAGPLCITPATILDDYCPTPTGKHQSLSVVSSFETNSQSTSGYSSPNSYSSNLYSIKEFDIATTPMQQKRRSIINPIAAAATGFQTLDRQPSSNILKIYVEPPEPPMTNMHTPSTTLIKTINRNSIKTENGSSADEMLNPLALTSSKSNSANKSFLLFKKRTKLMPQSDFQNRILKSECLAYLTDEELIERHTLNRKIIRNIEMNVAQKVKGCNKYST